MFISVCVCVNACIWVHMWKSEDNFWDSVLTFHLETGSLVHC